MSLDSVPLTVRVGNQHITRDVAGLSFRKEAVGGVQNITLRLKRPLDRFDSDLAALSKVYVYDARSAVAVAEARLSDIGRSASSNDGQTWDMTCFGPAQHAYDKTFPYIMIDRSLERWTRQKDSTKAARTQQDELDADSKTLEILADEGKTVTTSWLGVWIYRGLIESGQNLARIDCTFDAGITNTDYLMRVVVGSTVAVSASASTTAAAKSAVVSTDFTNPENTPTLRALRQTSNIAGAETHWFQFSNVSVRATRYDKDGTVLTPAANYTTSTMLADGVVKDLLGRILDQYDGANAIVDGTASYAIDQLAYPDGVTAGQVLEDLMDLEPAYRWFCGPSTSAGKYAFTWALWPTSVRYEALLDDGGDFPASSQELYNQVTVRYRHSNGQIRQVTSTGACPILDAAGITRSTIIDAADEIGSAAAATRLGANFLADHKYPKNAGTLTIARPIRDLTTGAMVRPHEIEPGELIRVRGIESYPDALNASSNDGQTVFRIWAMEYTSDSDAATLELDSWPRTTAHAIAKLKRARARKR